MPVQNKQGGQTDRSIDQDWLSLWIPLGKYVVQKVFKHMSLLSCSMPLHIQGGAGYFDKRQSGQQN